MSEVRLRPATFADQPLLERWDEDDDVTSASGNDHLDTAGVYENGYWTHELAIQSDVYEYFIAEVREGDDWRPIGAIQIIDPHREPTHYWGEIEPNLRAIDIWLGEPGDRGKGYGDKAMTVAIERCFASADVAAIVIDPLNSNTRAIKFYQRMGFVPTHRQTFGDDDCLVHRLERQSWEQLAVARRFGTRAMPTAGEEKLGVSRDLVDGSDQRPIHGLRHTPEGGTCGWYLWVDELHSNPDFFVPLHAEHLTENLPFVSRYLGLPPGWRFLVTETHEDVWFDPALLTTRQGD